MTPERWRQAQQLFEAALEFDADGRAAFLAVACGEEETLRREVESLLAADDQADGFLDVTEQAAASLRANINVGEAAMIGRQFGPYRVTGLLASGGMGTVYLAERADAQYEKQVAIKFVRHELLRHGLDSEEIYHRFRYERQILARLDHPYIARLLDGGTTEDGLPYFLMEYVEGLPINVYCERNHLGATERLNLFLKVCEAVWHANKNQVIHRDLKPGNILVTADGAPKLLDFGVAKLLRPDATQTCETAPWLRPITLAYASPEQVCGGKITDAADVYSLGVVLYELLAGRRPYRLTGGAFEELTRAICEQEPEKPSVAAGWIETQRRRLPRDLDYIVLMALRKEPEHRYASVEHMAEDIRGFLAGRPVRARKRTMSYRAVKFLKRQRGVVLASVLTALAFLVASAGVWTSSGWFGGGRLTGPETHHDEARKLYDQGRALWSMRTEGAMREGIASFEQAIALDPNFAAAYAGLADSYVIDLNGLPRKEALSKGKEAAIKALELDDRLAEVHSALAFAIWRLDFDWAAAEREFRRAIELNPDYYTARQWYGLLLAGQGRFDESLEQMNLAQALAPASLNISADIGAVLLLARQYDRSVAKARKAIDLDPNFVSALRVLSSGYAMLGRFDEAIAAGEKAAALDRRSFASLAPLGYAYARAGRVKEAERLLQEAERRLTDRADKGVLMQLYLGLDRRDDYFAAVEQAIEDRNPRVYYLNVNPTNDHLRDDPRFKDVLRRVGLAP
ncbi:MAG: protein kinase domain-containing protein [Blastocatellia bacterium]